MKAKVPICIAYTSNTCEDLAQTENENWRRANLSSGTQSSKVLGQDIFLICEIGTS